MPLNTRDLWLILKAQDQTNRALNTFSRNVRNAGDTVAMAQLQARKAAALGAIAQARLANENQRAQIIQGQATQTALRHANAIRQNTIAVQRAEVAQMSAQKAVLAHTMATLKSNNASQAQIDGVKAQSAALTQQINTRKLIISQLQAEVAAERENINAVQEGINARKARIAGNQQFIFEQRKVISGINDEIQAVEAHNKSLQEHEKHLARISQRMQMVSQTATAMGFAMAAAGVATVIGIKSAIDTAVEYERQVRATATQVDGFSGNLVELADIGRRTAREIAVPFEQIQPALFDIFSSMEVSVGDAEKLLNSFSKAAVAGQVDIQDVSRATIGLLNAFQRPASDVNKLLDIQFQLVQEGVGSYEEWNQRIGLVTPSAVRAGQSIEVMMAALAASTRMGMSAARSGTAVARAFDALSNPKTVGNLKALGVSVQDAQGKFRPFNEVLRDFRDVLNKMPEKDRLATILDVFKGAGGTIEARRFLQNVLLGAGNLEMFDNILKETSNSAGSMENAYTLMSESVAAKTQLLKNQWTLLKESLGRALAPAFAQVVGWLSNLLEKFNQMPPKSQKTIAVFLALAGIFASLMGPLLLLIGAIAAVVGAFVVAGPAIAIVLGILAAFVIAVAVLTTAFTILFQKSEGFRGILDQMGKNFNNLKAVVVEFGREIRKSFEQHLQGPLSKLWDLINGKVIPAFKDLYKTFSEAMLPKLKEASRIVVDLADGAFKKIGEIITNVVIPGIEALVNWWNKNKDSIKPLLEVLGQVLKWFIIIAAVITGVLVAALVGTLLVAVGLVVGVFALLAMAGVYLWKGLKWLWDKIVSFGKWIAEVFVGMWQGSADGVSSAWDAVASFFTGIWDSIKNVFSGAWGWITEQWNAFSGWFAGVWDKFWRSDIGQLFIAIWNLLVAAVLFGWAVIKLIFFAALASIAASWNAVWSAVSAFFGVIWNEIKSNASAAWAAIVAVWNAVWPPVRDFFVTIWNGIKAAAKAVWGAMVSVASILFNGLKSFLSGTWDGIKSAAKTAWDAFYNYVVEPVKKAHKAVTDAIQAIRDFIMGKVHDFQDAGREIIEGLIRGITDKIDALRKKTQEATKIISDMIPGSPVKKGPLRVLNHGYAGGQIVNMLADGMSKRMGALDMSTSLMANSVLPGTGAIGGSSVNGGGGMAGAVKNYYITQNITTQELNPLRQAAALGWEVTTVM